MDKLGRRPLPEKVENNGLYARQNMFIRNFAKGLGLSDKAILRLMVDQIISLIESESLDLFSLDNIKKEKE